jgi:hypothetical protein
MSKLHRIYAIIIAAALVIGLSAFLFVRSGGGGSGGLVMVQTTGHEEICGAYRTPGPGKMLVATSGWELVSNTSGQSVTVTSVRPIKATNLIIEDLALVPLTGRDAVGASYGLPTEPHDVAASLIPGDWAMRLFLPAVIPPKATTPKVKDWQLVFGLGVPKAAPSTIQGAIITYKAGGHTYTLQSNIGQAYGPPGKASCEASETAS